ncbi:MAG TPA: PRC-barrel domain-containing protein [Hyphomicrobium sp.]|nr:PRC-barrel domain-containing protein [Hyphomicrobium sp.]
MTLRPPPNNSLVSSDDVEGTKVYDAEGNAIGSIDRLMIDQTSGKIVYALVNFGGVLTAGHNHYPLPWSALRYDAEANSYSTNVTDQQLQNAPHFSGDSLDSRVWEQHVHIHFEASPYWVSRPEG